MKTDKTDNEIIAEFMGEVVFQKRPRHYIGVTENMKPYKLADKLKYNTSWDWLMPVVEKINKLNHVVHIYPTRARFYKTNTDFIESIHPGYSLIDVVYCGVVEFIKWYNQQGK